MKLNYFGNKQIKSVELYASVQDLVWTLGFATSHKENADYNSNYIWDVVITDCATDFKKEVIITNNEYISSNGITKEMYWTIGNCDIAEQLFVARRIEEFIRKINENI